MSHADALPSPQSSVLSPQSSVLSPQSSVLSPQSSVLSPQSSVLSPAKHNPPVLTATARGIALFLGIFTLLNLASDLRVAGESGNTWWISLPPVVLGFVAMTFITWAFTPHRARLAMIAAVTVAIAGAAADAIRYYVVLARGGVRSAFPIPLSLLIVAAMVVVAIALAREPVRGRLRAVAIACAACAIVFPLAQIATYGLTDYRRPADVIVVFGAKAFPDGTLSDALADRVVTGCELYRAGLAPHLFFSGGPGEPEAMQRLALRLGVPRNAILDDPRGVNTESTVRNTMTLLHPPRILAVSHFYHLPRVKMTYQRYGATVYTVPSRNEAGGMLYNLARETAAFWRYYARRMGGGGDGR